MVTTWPVSLDPPLENAVTPFTVSVTDARCPCEEYPNVTFRVDDPDVSVRAVILDPDMATVRDPRVVPGPAGFAAAVLMLAGLLYGS